MMLYSTCRVPMPHMHEPATVQFDTTARTNKSSQHRAPSQQDMIKPARRSWHQPCHRPHSVAQHHVSETTQPSGWPTQHQQGVNQHVTPSSHSPQPSGNRPPGRGGHQSPAARSIHCTLVQRRPRQAGTRAHGAHRTQQAHMCTRRYQAEQHVPPNALMTNRHTDTKRTLRLLFHCCPACPAIAASHAPASVA
jgi:hypothetical protein